MRRALTILLVSLCATAPSANAQQAWSDACNPPLKYAAGACVAACPAGYEDQGRACVFRSYSR